MLTNFQSYDGSRLTINTEHIVFIHWTDHGADIATVLGDIHSVVGRYRDLIEQLGQEFKEIK